MEIFIDLHCREEWPELRELESFGKQFFCLDSIYLVDEMYGSGDAPVSTQPEAKFWLANVSTSSDTAADLRDARSVGQVIYFRQFYRSETWISKVCAKLRRLVDQTAEEDGQNPRLEF